MFSSLGFKVETVPDGSLENGIDIIAKLNEETFLVEAKDARFLDASDVMKMAAVQEKFRDGVGSNNVTGVIVSSGSVTHSGSELSKEAGILLISGNDSQVEAQLKGLATTKANH